MPGKSDSDKRIDEALKKHKLNDFSSGQPDVSQYFARKNDKSFLIGQKVISIRDGNTIAQYTSEVDDAGNTYSSSRLFELCDCRCKIASDKSDVYRCAVCQNKICAKHAVIWKSKGLAYCKSMKCQIALRIAQIFAGLLSVMKFCARETLGIGIEEKIEQQPEAFDVSPDEIITPSSDYTQYPYREVQQLPDKSKSVRGFLKDRFSGSE